VVGEAQDSIRALATVTLDARALEQLGPQTLDRLAELVEARLRTRRAAGEESLLSVGGVAELTGLSRALIYREIERGHLLAYRVGRRLRIAPEAVAEWKRRCVVRPRSEPPAYEPVLRRGRGPVSASFAAELDAIERDGGKAA
jgi:excisionase family DNA binding protein